MPIPTVADVVAVLVEGRIRVTFLGSVGAAPGRPELARPGEGGRRPTSSCRPARAGSSARDEHVEGHDVTRALPDRPYRTAALHWPNGRRLAV